MTDGVKLSASTEWRLLEGLYDQKTTLIVGGLMPSAVGIVCFLRTGLSWYLLWSAAALVVLCGRLVLDAAFRRSNDRSSDALVIWRRRFLIGCSLAGALSGVAAALTRAVPDAFTQTLVNTLITSYVMGAASRNAVYPLAAYAFILLAEVPLAVACLFSGDEFYRTYVAFTLCYIFISFAFVRYLYDQVVRFLITDEQNVALLNDIRNANAELGAANRSLAMLAKIDALTGLANRRRFDEQLLKESRRVQRSRTNLSLLMLDIDCFKLYNDRYGHPAGDRCLFAVGQALTMSLRRPSDTVARYGGEEFSAILPDTDADGAAALGEDIRAAVEALGIEHADSPRGVVTVSIGVATVAPGQHPDTQDLLRLADEALYSAKRAGRNCVNVAATRSRFRARVLAAGDSPLARLGAAEGAPSQPSETLRA